MWLMKRVLNMASTVLVAVVVLAAVLLVGARLFGFNVYAVLSGSMEPALPVGSLVCVAPESAESIQEGDVISFMASEDLVVTHRVVGVEVAEDGSAGDAGGLRFRTQGDANSTPDASPVLEANLIGKVVFVVPALGYLVDAIQHPPGSYIAIVLAALLVLSAVLPALFTKKDQPAPKHSAD